MYEWTRPQIGVPVHGEAAHLVAQGSLMAAAGIPEVAQVRDGDMLRLAPGPAEIIDQVPYGRLYKDGRLVGTDEAMGIRDRRKLSFAGHVAINVVLDEKYELAGDPDIVADRRRDGRCRGRGPGRTHARRGDRRRRKHSARSAARISTSCRKRCDARSARAANEAWGKKPLVTVFVTR